MSAMPKTAPHQPVDLDAFAGVRSRIAREMEDGDIPGLAVAAVEGDRLAWVEGFGFTDGSRAHAVDADTPFSAQSLSKTYTAVTFLVAASRGLVELDEPLRAVLPEFSIHSRWGDAECNRITFRHLLTHRAGLPAEAPLGNNYDARTCTFAEHVASLRDAWLKHPVGDRLAYSNVGYDLVARALERLTGFEFPTLVARELLGPLGMTRSTFDPEALLRSGLYAKGHRGLWETDNHRPATLGGGGLFASAHDAGRFLSFLLRGCTIGGEPLVRADLLAEMVRIPNPTPGQTGGQALGLVVEEKRGMRVLRHLGGGSGYFAIHAWAPERGIGAVVFMNQSNCSPVHLGLCDDLFTALLSGRGTTVSGDAPGLAPRCATSAPSPRAAAFAGVYRRGDATREVEERGGDIVLDRDVLRPASAIGFAQADGTRVTFRGAETGRAREMELQGTSDLERWPLDHAPGDPPGPDRPEWRAWRGIYSIFDEGLWFYAAVCVRDGHLHIVGQNGDARLREFRPGLFLTADGDTVLFRDVDFVWANAQVHAREDDAWAKALRLAAADPGDRRVTFGSLLRLRDACRALGDREGADRVLDLNLRLRPAVPTLLRIADVHREDDPDEAAGMCRRVLALEPENEDALRELAAFRADAGRGG